MIHSPTRSKHTGWLSGSVSGKKLRGWPIWRMRHGHPRTFLFYRAANVLPYDNIAARIDDSLSTRSRRMGTKDRRIAAITLAHGYILVTRNTVDFKDVPGLTIEDWMAS